jgi:hypothetical protein
MSDAPSEPLPEHVQQNRAYWNDGGDPQTPAEGYCENPSSM